MLHKHFLWLNDNHVVNIPPAMFTFESESLVPILEDLMKMHRNTDHMRKFLPLNGFEVLIPESVNEQFNL